MKNLEVTVDGIKYFPEGSQAGLGTKGKIGVGITTRNRNKQIKETLRKWKEFTPEYIEIIIVDDSSTIPVEEATFRFEENVGIAQAKNKCLELLEDRGVTEFFLADDDVYPLCSNWWEPYVASPEPHLMAMFLDLAGSRKLKDIKVIYEDGDHVAYTGPRGYLLYANSSVLQKVGGMDPIYGKWGWEHGDWSNRIHHAGLTSWRYADIQGSQSIFHSMDQYEEIERSVSTTARKEVSKHNASIHNARREELYQAFVPYRPQKDIVITCLYGSKPDPQRPGKTMNTAMLAPLMKSLSEVEVVLFTDSEYEQHTGVQVIESQLGTNVFFQRHLNAFQYLRAHPEVRFAWCVDGTDVEMLKSPFSEMEAGRLYVGYEPKLVGNEWMIKNHSTPVIQKFIQECQGEQLLNAGVFGGDRETMLEFLHHLVQYWFDREMNIFNKTMPAEEELGDMGCFNYITRTYFADRVIWGTRVTTIFKNDEWNSFSWWKHK